MTNMTDSKCIDSSVWIDYLINEKNKETIEEVQGNITSVFSLIEVYTKLIKLKVPELEVKKKVNSIKTYSQIQEVTIEIAEKARAQVAKGVLHTADAIIYATAEHAQKQLITLDNDFRGLPNVQVI